MHNKFWAAFDLLWLFIFQTLNYLPVRFTDKNNNNNNNNPTFSPSPAVCLSLSVYHRNKVSDLSISLWILLSVCPLHPPLSLFFSLSVYLSVSFFLSSCVPVSLSLSLVISWQHSMTSPAYSTLRLFLTLLPPPYSILCKKWILQWVPHSPINQDILPIMWAILILLSLNWASLLLLPPVLSLPTPPPPLLLLPPPMLLLLLLLL